MPEHLPSRHAHGLGGHDLGGIDGVERAAEHLGQVGAGDQPEAQHHRAQRRYPNARARQAEVDQEQQDQDRDAAEDKGEQVEDADHGGEREHAPQPRREQPDRERGGAAGDRDQNRVPGARGKLRQYCRKGHPVIRQRLSSSTCR